MGKILYAEHEGVHVLKFVGDVRLTLGPTISAFLEELKECEGFRSILIDMSETQAIDSTALGLVVKIAISVRENFGSTPSIISPNEDITRILRSMAMEQVCVVIHGGIDDDMRGLSQAQFQELVHELAQGFASEDVLRDQVLEAHKVLMSLNASNRDKFKDLVAALEEEKAGRLGYAKAG